MMMMMITHGKQRDQIARRSLVLDTTPLPHLLDLSISLGVSAFPMMDF